MPLCDQTVELPATHQVTFLPLPRQLKLILNLDEKLSWHSWLVICAGDIPARRRSNIQY